MGLTLVEHTLETQIITAVIGGFGLLITAFVLVNAYRYHN